MRKLLLSLVLFTSIHSFSQSNKPSMPPHNWQLMDWQKDGYAGISVEKAYTELLKNKKPLKKIIVAVVDCGLDETQPDLAGMEWTNKKEIPGNGIDDDGNGYADDVHGWNFTGNLTNETLEEIREYVKLKGKFENKADSDALQKDPQYNYWQKVVAAKDEKMNDMEATQKRSGMFLNNLQVLQNYWSRKRGNDSVYVTDIKNHQPDANSDSSVLKAQSFLTPIIKNIPKRVDSTTLTFIITKVKDGNADNDYALQTAKTIIEKNDVEYFRKTAVGDDPNTNTKRNYGNGNITAFESHGTECAGTIAALRNNNIGGNGITNSVEIMVIRMTATHSYADERDKDVANAIRYAADNGAQVVSMSFGKTLSPQKEWVDEAVKYAEKKGVLLIAAAGNEATNSDSIPDYPSETYNDNTRATNLMKIGASTYDSSLIASFSNYGAKTVDVFAPGVSIYTSSLHNEYEAVDGTSFATPMVAGLAAFIWSYYPKLTYKQIRYCIEKSATPVNILVTKPGTQQKVPFSSLSKAGGIVNAYKAMLIAGELTAELNMSKYKKSKATIPSRQ